MVHARRILTLLGATACLGASATAGNATPGQARLARAAGHESPGPPPALVAPGTNLLRNSRAQAGVASVRGWDAVTIPGWRVDSGLPTVVGGETPGFPRVGASTRMFAGGSGGTARLTQWVGLPGGDRARRARYTLSARLGASATSAASIEIAFESGIGQVLGARRLGPVRGASRRAARALVARTLRGRLPLDAARAAVTLVLATSLSDVDGPDAPLVGYDRAVADDLRFSLGAPGPAPVALKPPPSARVPHYQHVFLFYFENEDARAIVGNRREAPFYNALIPQGASLDRMYAEEHPSDGNYLALAGGSTFGIPLDDPLEENPLYTIHAADLADRLDAAGETWKEYDQSAAGPCDDTVHAFHWDDDLPMLYFADVRDRPAYCAAHVVPLEAMEHDLARPSTTPAFSWIGVNDCDDMEGCGIRAGDRFLADELSPIMRSPAWRRQRSLAIVTFDEDGYDHERPAQRVPTLILASHGVRRGDASTRRLTHYSLLRTIEAALGLRSLTANDRFAQTLDVFSPGASGARLPANSYARASSPRARAGARPTAPAPRRGGHRPSGPPTAFVVDSTGAEVTPIGLDDRRAERPIPVGALPGAIALAPGGRTAYVVNAGSDSVTPIDTVTHRAERAIPVGRDPIAIAIAPDGTTAYVSDEDSDAVTPVDLRTDQPGRPIPVGVEPREMAIAPGGHTLYVCDWGGATVTPVALASDTPERPIRVGAYPDAIAFAERGRLALVADYGSDELTPIAVPASRAEAPIAAGVAPDALAVDGNIAEVVDGDTERVTQVDLRDDRATRSIPVGDSPTAIAIAGETAYTVDTISQTLTPIVVRRGRAETPIHLGGYDYPTRIAVAPDGHTAVVLGTDGASARLVDLRTRRVSRAIRVGGFPVAVAITR